jgi:hypothetical protein
MPYLANLRISKHSQDKSREIHIFANFYPFYVLSRWPLKMLGQIGPRASRERVKEICQIKNLNVDFSYAATDR